MVTGTLAKVGVEAVVEGINGFKKAFSTMNDAVDKFAAKGSFLSKVFRPVTAVFDTFFESLRRIGEFVVAGLILRGFDAIAGAVKDLALEVYDAAVNFQLLKIRLQTFLATELMASGAVDNMKEALVRAQEPAAELFDWMLKLAMTTPFDTQDVADTFTMAKAWGFATDEAKKLTIQVSDFAAGMGFGSQEMDRVIKALGQMKSLGRVAGQELLQLANAGVPVADIMQNIREELGLTTEEFEKLRMKGGVSAEMFFEQWDKLISERFEGSAIRASKTITGVLGNIKDFFTGVFGMKLLVPILDEVARKLSAFLEALTEGERFDRLLGIVQQLGEYLNQFVNDIFDSFSVTPEGLADNFIDLLDKIKGKIVGILEVIRAVMSGEASKGQGLSSILQILGVDEGIAGNIGAFIDNLGKLSERIKEIFSTFKEEGFMAGLEEIGVPEPILNFIDTIIKAFGNLVQFWDENKETLMLIASGIISQIAQQLGFENIEGEKVSLLEKLGEVLLAITQWILDNPDKIIGWLIDFGAFLVIATDNLIEFGNWIIENKEDILEFLENFGRGLYAIWVIGKVFGAAKYQESCRW